MIKIKYIDIQDKKIDVLDKETLKTWLLWEIASLANDFGQNLSDEMKEHIITRLMDVFQNKYKSWYVGTIHATFQTGLNGGYGTFHKITVKTIFTWMAAAQKQLTNIIAEYAKIESENRAREYVYRDDIYTQFIIWATKKMICLNHVNPGWDSLKMKQVSPGVQKLAHEWSRAKQNNTLEDFEIKLRIERDKFLSNENN